MRKKVSSKNDYFKKVVKLTLLVLTIVNCLSTFAQGGSLRTVNLNEFTKVQESKEYKYGSLIYKCKFSFYTDQNATSKNKEFFGILDRNNREVFPPLLRSIKFKPEILKFIGSINGKHGLVYYGVLDTLGKWVIKPEVSKEDDLKIQTPTDENEKVNGLFPNNKIIYYYRKYIEDLHMSKYGAVDYSGKTIIPFMYDNHRYLKDGYGYSKLGIGSVYGGEVEDKEALVDPLGKILTGFDYSSIFFEKELFAKNKNTTKTPQPMLLFGVKKNGLYGFINEKGTLIVPTKLLTYGDINEVEGTIVASLDLVGLINYKGQVLLPFEYNMLKYDYRFDDQAQKKYYPIIIAKKDGKWGLIDAKTYEVKVPFKYDDIFYEPKTKQSKVELGYKNFGVVDEYGKEVIPIEYEKIQLLTTKYISVTKKGKTGIVNYFGQTVISMDYEGFIQQQFSSLLADELLFEPKNTIGVLYKIKKKKYEIFYVSEDGALTDATDVEQEKVKTYLENEKSKKY